MNEIIIKTPSGKDRLNGDDYYFIIDDDRDYGCTTIMLPLCILKDGVIIKEYPSRQWLSIQVLKIDEFEIDKDLVC